MTIAIDFDGTIRDPKTNRPVEGARDAICRMREDGHKVIIHSCNSPTFIEVWMNDVDIRYDKIWGSSSADIGKPIADLYVDDKGFKFEGWADTNCKIEGEK